MNFLSLNVSYVMDSLKGERLSINVSYVIDNLKGERYHLGGLERSLLLYYTPHTLD